MWIVLTALGLFAFGYILNMFYITVLYHRGLTHQSIILGPKMMRWLSLTGIWVTGLDPKGWATMHRLHHLHSDTEKDPHSPIHQGVLGVWIGQYKGYRDTLSKLMHRNDPEVNKAISDIPFDISRISRVGLSNLPYIIHALITLAIWYFTGYFLIAAAYFFGIMSHPVQGWMVNSLAHKYGGRNFETSDHSKNNLLVALFVFGEGFQNNHHAFPRSAKFSVKKMEIDFGYAMCLVGEKLGLFKIARPN